MTDLETAYFAGFFDGEGHIGIARRKQKVANRTPPYHLFISISNTNWKIMYQIQNALGGTMITRKRGNTAQAWQWSSYCREAANILRRIEPYLVVKKDECEVALEFQKHMQECTSAGYQREGLKKGRPVLSAEQLAFRENCYQRIKQLRADKKL